MARTDLPEQVSPDRHFFVAVRSYRGLTANGRGDLERGILSSVVLAQCCEVGGRRLQCLGRGTVAFAFRAMARGAIAREHPFTRSWGRRLKGNVLDSFLGLFLG